MQLQGYKSVVRGQASRGLPNLLQSQRAPAHRISTGRVFKGAFPSFTSRPGHTARAAEAATIPTTSANTAAPSTEAGESATDTEQYDFERQWYPVGILEDLDPKVPKAVTLLGKDLVLWRDPQGAWRCFEDLCPHRLAPLSEGRIEPSDGTLQCAYHGWKFEGSGRCTDIPQIAEPKAMEVATASKRSCARTYPTQEIQGLLWVFPTSGPTAELEAAATPPALIPQLEASQGEENDDYKFHFKWFMRDLPYSYDILLENVADASHVPFAHHGVQGNRARPSRFSAKVVEALSKDRGFELNIVVPGAKEARSTLTFRPPSLLNYHSSIKSTLSVYAIPTRPGQCRIVAGGVRAPNPNTPLFQRLYTKAPKWVDHILQRNLVLDGDGIFLRLGEKNLRVRNNEWNKQFYLAASTDGTVVWMRKWLDRFAGRTGPCASTGPADLPRMSRREALDHWEQHTLHCPSCMAAHTNFGRLQAVAAAAAAACLVAAAATAKAATSGLAALLQPQTALWLAGAAFALLLRSWFKGIAQKFVFEDYVHATR